MRNRSNAVHGDSYSAIDCCHSKPDLSFRFDFRCLPVRTITFSTSLSKHDTAYRLPDCQLFRYKRFTGVYENNAGLHAFVRIPPRSRDHLIPSLSICTYLSSDMLPISARRRSKDFMSHIKPHIQPLLATDLNKNKTKQNKTKQNKTKQNN